MVNEPVFVFVDWSFVNYLPHCMTTSERLHISPYQRAFAECSVSAGPRPVEVRSEDGPPAPSVLTDPVALVLRLIVVILTWLEEFWILLLNIPSVVIKLSDLQCPWFQVLVWLLCLSKLSMAVKRLGTDCTRQITVCCHMTKRAQWYWNLQCFWQYLIQALLFLLIHPIVSSIVTVTELAFRPFNENWSQVTYYYLFLNYFCFLSLDIANPVCIHFLSLLGA